MFHKKLTALLLCVTSVILTATAFAVCQGNTTVLPIIMYHHISKNSVSLGDYVISVTQLENDIRYLSKNGYETVTTKDLLSFRRGEKALPEKPCMLTFDDGFLSVAEYAVPILKKYGMKAVITVIGKEVSRYSEIDDKNPEYAYLNGNALKKLETDGTLDIQCHTYDMHNLWPRKGCDKIYGETSADYCNALYCDIKRFNEIFMPYVGRKTTAIALPFGAYCSATIDNLQKLGFSVIFTCTEKVNVLSNENCDLSQLGRYNRPSGVTSELFFEKIEKAIQSKKGTASGV